MINFETTVPMMFSGIYQNRSESSFGRLFAIKLEFYHLKIEFIVEIGIMI